jgi:hypothetical protein
MSNAPNPSETILVANEPAEVEESAPDADTASDHGSEDAEEEIGDLGGDADDGDDSNPHKFIEKSLHYQDIVMTKKHCEERVEFFTKFADGMAKSKYPKKKMREFKYRLTVVDKRLGAFKDTYAAKRKEMAAKRAARAAKAKEARDKDDELRKPLKSAINKDLKKKHAVAEKAAMEAIAALGDSADKDAVMAAGLAAFAQTFMKSLADAPIDAPKTPEAPDADEPAVDVAPAAEGLAA